ncbi:MAG: 16S rRNA (guanine(966)-N(2))-methyltransferase RsmD [Bacteroidetes bacterium 4572_77]|nr:MAG: 16S rRNA (guanine(966)-N(2))-methyltransferase RsmD [Bacteroidetes bacterium 4572_77]
MRIISGFLGKRRLKLPKNLRLRPTTDIAKEGLFNILNNRLFFEEMRVLDLFAGTGNISYEFISRGVQSATIVESNLVHFKYITSVKKDLGLQNLMTIKADVFKFLEYNTQEFELIFADPPYDLEELKEIPEKIFAKTHLSKKGLFILEHPEEYDFSDTPHFLELRRYGKVHFSFFQKLE